MAFTYHVIVDLSTAPLEALGARATNLTPVFLDKVDKLVTAFLVAQFTSEGSYGGEKWAALAPRTLEYRKLPGHGRGGIGRDTNRLWASLVKSPSSEGVVNVTPTHYERGTNVPYAKFFSEGTYHQPARQIFPPRLPIAVEQPINQAIANYIATGVTH